MKHKLYHLGMLMPSLLFAVLAASAMERSDYALPPIASIAEKLYVMRTSGIARLFPCMAPSISEGIELYYNDMQKPPALRISCLFSSLDEYKKRTADASLAIQATDSLDQQLLTALPYLAAHGELASEDHILMPYMQEEIKALEQAAAMFSRCASTRTPHYLWPEDCHGSFCRFMLRTHPVIAINKLDDTAIALNHPIIRQWGQEDPQIPPKRQYELLCLAQVSTPKT